MTLGRRGTSLRRPGFSLEPVTGVLQVKTEHRTARGRVEAMRTRIAALAQDLAERMEHLRAAQGLLDARTRELDAGEPYSEELLGC